LVLLRSYRDVDKPSLLSSIIGRKELNSRLTEAHNRREEGPTATNHWIKLKKMKFFPVALVQKTVPEIRGIFVIRSNLKKLIINCKKLLNFITNPRNFFTKNGEKTVHFCRGFYIHRAFATHRSPLRSNYCIFSFVQ
jgi:hypothetical protein